MSSTITVSQNQDEASWNRGLLIPHQSVSNYQTYFPPVSYALSHRNPQSNRLSYPCIACR